MDTSKQANGGAAAVVGGWVRQAGGFEDETALFAAAISDSVCTAIYCNRDNPDCDYTAEMEPDQDRGWCEVCERGTLVSGLILGGLI